MTDYAHVYRNHADRYEELVRAEDTDGNLPRALGAIIDIEGSRVVEVGAGTGRVTRIVLEAGAAHVFATEREASMLDIARQALAVYGDRVQFEVADAADLSAETGRADLAIAGWVFGHFRHWMPESWRDDIGTALDELERATRKGGSIVVIETLGTGQTDPAPPNEALAEYYAWLSDERGFERQTIRTDYRFESVDVAAEVTGFFFGSEFGERVQAQGWKRVPECTGVWSRRRP